jgi:hypothetical protein
MRKPVLTLVKTNPTEAEIMKLAEEIYEAERTDYMPPFDQCPYSYARGYINDAANRLGWKRKFNLIN